MTIKYIEELVELVEPHFETDDIFKEINKEDIEALNNWKQTLEEWIIIAK